VVDPVDLSTDEDSDPAVAPFTPVGQQVGNQQSQTCQHTHMEVLFLGYSRLSVSCCHLLPGINQFVNPYLEK